jgi:hypothetical protein
MTDAETRAEIERIIETIPETYCVSLRRMWRERLAGGEDNNDDFWLLQCVRARNEIREREEAQRRLSERNREIDAQKDVKTNVDYA